MSNNKTKIFAYNGHVGAITDIENGKFINDPTAAGQLGCVIDVNEIEISSEAKEIMKTKYTREGGSFAGTMLTKHTDGTASLGLLGGGKHLLGQTMEYGRDCDIEVLDMIEVNDELEAPDDFKEFIDSQDSE